MKRLLSLLLIYFASLVCCYSVFAQHEISTKAGKYDLNEYFELTTALDVGQQVKMYFKGSNVWVDLNNNQQFDEGEQAFTDTADYKMYTIGSQTFRVYGNVEEFLCRESRLIDVDFTHFPNIKALGVSKNELTSIDISQNLELDYFECNSNKISELNVTGLNKLKVISCQDNTISKLDISNKPGLYYLSVAKNKIKEPEMEEIVTNLPQKTEADPGFLYAAVLSPSEGNVMTPDQVANAKAKKWKVKAWNGSAWVEFEGTQTSVESIEANHPGLTARYTNGILYLDNLEVGEMIKVYGMDGRLALETVATNTTMSFSCGMHLGCYLISNGYGRTVKMLIGK
ncbi:hypothetical protein [Bacteroides heparinolyticus]|uniref:hypothetical protein n=1 Tax=Prevotella heparinolytica TaxID=28113 RepID=UPI0035A08825